MNTGLYSANRPQGRPVAFLAVVALHVAGFWALSHFGVIRAIVDEAPRLTAVLLNTPADPPPVEPRRRDPLRTPVTSELRLPDPAYPPDDAVPAGPDTLVVVPGGTVDPPNGGGGSGAGTTEPVLTPLTWAARRSTDEYYPPASARLEEEGATTLRVCVSAAGRLTGAPRIETSSGHARLDAAAVAWAREALAFRPATRDGVPVEACKGFRVTFDLR
jgi:protein TonB